MESAGCCPPARIAETAAQTHSAGTALPRHENLTLANIRKVKEVGTELLFYDFCVRNVVIL